MSSVFDEEVDYNAAVRGAKSDRKANAKKRLDEARGLLLHGVERQANIAATRIQQAGGDEADMLEAAASVWEMGPTTTQAAVSANGAQPQAVSSPDVIDVQVSGLEEDLRVVRANHERLEEDYRVLNEENGRLADAARRASDYLAQLEEANRQLRATNQEKERLEGRVTTLNTELNEARRLRDVAQDQLAQGQRTTAQTQQPAPEQQPRQEPTAPAAAPAQSPTDQQVQRPQQQGSQERQTQATRPPQSQRPNRQPRQEPTAPAAAPAQSPTNGPATRVMPTQRPAQPQGQQPRRFFGVLPGHNRGRSN